MNIPSPATWSKTDFLKILEKNISPSEKRAYFNDQMPSACIKDVKYEGFNSGGRKVEGGCGFFISIALPDKDEDDQPCINYTINLCIVRIHEEDDGIGWSVSVCDPLYDTSLEDFQNFAGVFLN